jgi:hypothetical membrane protein
VWLTVGALAGLLNVNFVLDLAEAHPASLARSVVSDLSVPGQPDAWVYRVTDAVSAVLVLALAIALARRARHAGRRVLEAVAWCLGGFGLCTVVAAVVTETCASTLVQGCTEATPLDDLHDTVSTLGSLAAVAAMALLAVAARRRRGACAAHVLATLVTGALGIALLVGSTPGTAPWFGWVQRAQIVVLSLWLVLAGRAVDVVRTGPVPRLGHRTERMAP